MKDLMKIFWIGVDILAVMGGISLVQPQNTTIMGIMMWGAPGLSVQMLSGLAVLVISATCIYQALKE